MHEGRQLTELLGEISYMSENQKDFIVSTDLMSYNPDENKLQVEGLGNFSPNSVAHDQMADKLGIPRKYYNRMLQQSPELLADNLNYWFKHDKSKKMLRTMPNVCRAFLSDRFFAIDNAVVMAFAVDKLIKAKAEVKSCELTEKRLYIQATYPFIEDTIIDDDIVQAGICISNSDVGHGSCKIEPLIYRLVCSNGMISKVALKKYHVGAVLESEDNIMEVISDKTKELKIQSIISEIDDVIEYSLSDKFFEENLNALKLARGRKIGAKQIEPSVKEISSRFSFVKHEAEELLHRLIEGKDFSQYGMANAVTTMANDVGNYDRAVDYERVGGNIAFMNENEWSAIVN